MQDGLNGGGRFIPADIVGVHTLSLLPSSLVAHVRATDNYTQHNTLSKQARKTGRSSKLVSQVRQRLVSTVQNLHREVLNPSPCE